MSTPEVLTGCARYAYRHPRTAHVAASRFHPRPHQAFATGDDRPAWAKPAAYDTRRAHGPEGSPA